MMKFAVTSCFIFALLASDAAATDRTEESFIPRYAVASSYFSNGFEADFSAAGGSLSHREAGGEANVPIVMKEGYRLTAGAKYRKNWLEFSEGPDPFGNQTIDLTRVDIPINAWIDLNNRWKLWGRVQPGWYSDFSNVGSDDFILTSLALLSYKWNDSMKIAFGAFYSRDLGEERLLPAVGFIFEPDQHWSVALTFPRAEVAYAPSQNSLFTARAVLAGAGWNIENPSGSGEDVDLNYRAIKVGIGYDLRLGETPWWGYLDGGLQVGQELEIEGGGYDFARELDSSAYISAGVKLRF